MGNAILLADKSVTIQKIVQLTFADDNFKIHCVSDGQAAIDAIPALQPDLILADISLPLKTGYDVCRYLRTESSLSAFSKTPVILLAGIYETMDEERAKQVEENVKEVQANDFLSKPFDPQILVAKVKQYMKPASQRVAEAEPENIFSATAPAENIFTTSESSEFQSVEPPPDDGERTMMIPGGVQFADNMFAESLPYEEEAAASKLGIENMTPEGESLFDADADDFSSDFEEQGGKTAQVDTPTFEPLESYNSPAAAETVFSQESNLAEDALPLVMPAEDPFAEVFDEVPASGPFVPAEASDEDSPFGLPPAPPEPEPQLEPPPERIKFQTLQPEEYEPPSSAEPVPVAEEEAYEDTWPGVVTPRVEPPVEELFESESSLTSDAISIDEAEELQADFTENSSVSAEQSEEAAPPAAQGLTDITSPVPLASSGSVAITDELVTRIAEQVVAKLSDRVVSEIVWQVVPDLAEKMIRRELEKLHAGEE